jgi:archaellum component FlaC
MPSRKKKGETQTPATKADLEELAQATAKGFAAHDKRFDRMENRLDRVENRLDRVEVKMDGAIKILQTIDERTQDWRDIPARMEKVEEEVASLSLKR